MESTLAEKAIVGGTRAPARKGSFNSHVRRLGFAKPERCRKQRVFQFREDRFRLVVGELFHSSPVRRNCAGLPLLAIVLGQFEEADATRLRPIIDNFGVDYSRHLSCARRGASRPVWPTRTTLASFRIA